MFSLPDAGKSLMKRSRKRKANRKHLLYGASAAALLCAAILFGMIIHKYAGLQAGPDPSGTVAESSAQAGANASGSGSESASGGAGASQNESEPDITATPVHPVKVVPAPPVDDDPPNKTGYVETPREKQIYSYLQIPHEINFEGDFRWSGDWGKIMASGREFYYWGCGICCLSSIFSTYRAEDIPPDVIYYETREYTDYNPDSGHGAVSWEQLRKMCRRYGYTAVLKTKPADYSQFQKDIYQAAAVIVLVAKQNDDKLWWYTNGHYVNLWEYDYATDSVFLSDPSGLFNRARVSLSDIYAALKTSSGAQYMIIDPGY